LFLYAIADGKDKSSPSINTYNALRTLMLITIFFIFSSGRWAQARFPVERGSWLRALMVRVD
jgi:hypothetical protein